MNAPNVGLDNIAWGTIVSLASVGCFSNRIEFVSTTGCRSNSSIRHEWSSAIRIIFLAVEISGSLVKRGRQFLLVIATNTKDFVGLRVGDPDHQQSTAAVHPLDRTRRPVADAQSGASLQRDLRDAAWHPHRDHHLADFELNADDLRPRRSIGVVRTGQSIRNGRKSRHAKQHPKHQTQRRYPPTQRLQNMQAIHDPNPLKQPLPKNYHLVKKHRIGQGVKAWNDRKTVRFPIEQLVCLHFLILSKISYFIEFQRFTTKKI